jgi:dTDP-4-amino-4,6-dideoxygalactose transaminase
VVPFLDMLRMHEALIPKFEAALRSVVSRSAFVNSQEVKDFEIKFAEWVGTPYCLGFSSGLDAETIGLRAFGLPLGSKVLCPAMTFIATTEAVSHAGLTPVLVDVDANGLMDMAKAGELLKQDPSIRAIMPVHLFGMMIDPTEIQRLKNEFHVKVYEDACQAHGAKYKGATAGAIGDASAFSFYPGKNLGALGDGGALCYKESALGDVAKALREHGQTQKYHHKYEGYTARLDNLQAAFLLIKLEHMNSWTQSRISAARKYAEHLSGLKHFQLQSTDFSGRHVFHLFVGLTSLREKLS